MRRKEGSAALSNPQVPVTAVASASVHGHSETTRAAVATMHNTTASIDASKPMEGCCLPRSRPATRTACAHIAQPLTHQLLRYSTPGIPPHAQCLMFITVTCPSFARVCLCACGAFVLGRDPASAPASTRRSCTCTSWLNRAGGCSFGGDLSL